MASKRRLPKGPQKKSARKSKPKQSQPTDDGGEIVDLKEDSQGTFTPTDDGGAIVQMEKDSRIKTADDDDFYANLVPKLNAQDVTDLGLEYHRRVDFDKRSREKRDKQYEEGIRRTGLGDDAPGGATFTGASRVVHPMLAKGAIDFSSRAIKEILPKGAVVKSFIPGKSTKLRVEKSQRKAAYMNWQCMEQMKGLRQEMEQGLTQSPLGGAFYLELIYDEDRKKPVPSMIPIDDVYLPYSASSFYTAERITVVEHITQHEFERRVKDGRYIDVDLLPPSMVPEKTKAAKATDKVEGKEDDPYNEDGLRDVYKIMCYADVGDKLAPKKSKKIKGESEADKEEDEKERTELNEDEDDGVGVAPYLISIDETTKEVLSIVRNWDEDDTLMEPMFWLVEFPFIPWRGAYPIGLTHIIGSLAASATGSLRALLDSAHINNMPTALKLKGAAFAGQSVAPMPTQVTEVTGGVSADDIRKVIMNLPFNPPSMVLFQLLQFVVEEAEGVVKVALDNLMETANAEMPVGTTLMQIEQGMKVLSAIHSRQHYAFHMFLLILHRINKMYLTDEKVMDSMGELLCYRSDFQGPMDVIPVSDPEIFTDVQRFAQMQLVAQRAQLVPQYYNGAAVERMILTRTKIPDADQLLLPSPEVTESNAVTENLLLALGRPTHAFPDQDHLAHIQVLCDFMDCPELGGSPIISQGFMPAALTHLKEHIVMWYVAFMDEQATLLVAKESKKDITISQLMEYKDPETRKELDKFFAQLSAQMIKSAAAQTFQNLPPVIQRAQQIIQQAQQAQQAAAAAQGQPQAQATIAKANIEDSTKQKELAQQQQQNDAENQLRTQEIQAENQRTQQELQAKGQQQQAENQTEMATTATKETHEDSRSAASDQVKVGVNTADNQTAESIAAAEILAGKHSNVSTGTEVGKHGSGDTP